MTVFLLPVFLLSCMGDKPDLSGETGAPDAIDCPPDWTGAWCPPEDLGEVHCDAADQPWTCTQVDVDAPFPEWVAGGEGCGG